MPAGGTIIAVHPEVEHINGTWPGNVPIFSGQTTTTGKLTYLSRIVFSQLLQLVAISHHLAASDQHSKSLVTKERAHRAEQHWPAIVEP